jgi:hypothetical protein
MWYNIYVLFKINYYFMSEQATCQWCHRPLEACNCEKAVERSVGGNERQKTLEMLGESFTEQQALLAEKWNQDLRERRELEKIATGGDIDSLYEAVKKYWQWRKELLSAASKLDKFVWDTANQHYDELVDQGLHEFFIEFMRKEVFKRHDVIEEFSLLPDHILKILGFRNTNTKSTHLMESPSTDERFRQDLRSRGEVIIESTEGNIWAAPEELAKRLFA